MESAKRRSQRDYMLTFKLWHKRIQNLSISRACQFVGISRQAYYKRNRADAARFVLDQQVADFVLAKAALSAST